jgi:CubicO group peptidase (beta-lactamase class C family)
VRKFIHIFVSIIACTSNLSIAENKPLDLLESEMDKIAKSNITTNGPGCSVGIIQDTKFIFKKSYGFANVEHQVPLSSSSVFRMASVSKQFTALAVLLLADDGVINLNDDIRAYLPDLHDYGVKVTINSMLGHFSGMADYDTLQKLLPKPLLSAAGGPFRLGDEDYLTNQEYYEVIKSLPLAQEPNQKQGYSNFAYYLLSVLVEKASGLSLRKFSDKHIFKPLGMHNTFFADDMREIIPNRADGYRTFNEANINGLKRYMTNLFSVGDGGLHTTIDDMLIWDNHFYSPKLGKNPKKLMEQMNTANGPYPDVDEAKWYYANGQYTDGRYFFHNGGWMGTSTSYVRRPDTNASVIAMCNSSSLDANAFTYPTFQILTDLGLWNGIDPSIF